MAAPETQFGQPSLNIGYNYQPVETRLNPPMQLPGTGELWAQVGKTAMDAASRIQSSALNPAVREQMKYAISNYQMGESQNAYVRSLGPWGHLLVQNTPEGASVLSPGQITNPTLAARLLDRMGLGVTPTPPGSRDGQKKDGQDTTSAPSAPGTDVRVDAQGNKEFYNPTSGNWERVQTSATSGSSTSAPAKQKTEAAPSKTINPGDLLTNDSSASTDNNFLLTRMMQERHAAGLGGSEAAPQGTPASMTFTNPATGNVQAYQTPTPPQEPAAPTTPSPGMFAARAAAPPPEAPTAQPENMLLQGAQPPQTQPGSAISQVTQQPGVALANWQNQNVHPVIAPKAVLDAVKTNVSTAAQDATYLPNGGVNGEPAWAIHMRGGGMTTLSASQLASSPWGRALMVTHNASESLEAQNPPQPTQMQPPTPMPSGTGMGAPQGVPAPSQPPPAPSIPMPSGTGAGAPQGAPAQPPAAPGMAYNAAAYQMPQGPTITQTGEVNPALMAGGSDEQALAAARAAQTPPQGYIEKAPDYNPTDFANTIRGYSQDQLDKMTEDPSVGDFNGFHVYQDRVNGQFYSTKKSPSSTLNQARYIWGSPGWEDMPMDESAYRQTLRELRANTPQIAKLTDEQTRTMPIGRVQELVDAAVRFHATSGNVTDQTTQSIQGSINQSQSLARLMDGVKAADAAGIKPGEYTTEAEDKSRGAAAREAVEPRAQDGLYGTGIQVLARWPKQIPLLGNQPLITNPVDTWRWLQARYHDLEAERGPIHPFVDELTREAKYFNAQMNQTPGLQYTREEAPGQKSIPINIGYQGAGINTALPVSGETSPLDQVNRVFQNQSSKEVLRGLQQVKARIDTDLLNKLDEARRFGYRIPPEFESVERALKNHQDIPDISNPFRELTTGSIKMPDELRDKPPAVAVSDQTAANASTTPPPRIPIVRAGELEIFKRNNPNGGQFYDEQGNLLEYKPKKR